MSEEMTRMNGYERMMRMIPVVIWLAFGIAGAGLYRTSLYHEGKYCGVTSRSDERMDQAISVLFGALGPVYFVAALGISGFGYTGWSLSPYLCEKNQK